MDTALVVIGILVALAGSGVALTGRPLPWLDGQTAKPVFWGLGYLLLGVCVIVMGALLGHHPAGLWFAAPIVLLVAALTLITVGSRGTLGRGRG